MNCSSCGAPLPAKSNICRFCHTINDTDLRGIRRRVDKGKESRRDCPRCAVKMNHVRIKLDEKMYIERCPKCLGIFFDPGELETLLDASVSNVYEVDHHRLQVLIEQERQVSLADDTVQYVKCPDCRRLMNRRNFGARSGVVVDRCAEHGVWLDGGELGQLLKWVKAGGQKLDDKRKQEQRKAEERRRRLQRQTGDGGLSPHTGLEGQYPSARPHAFEGDVLVGALRVVLSLFR